MEKRTTAKEVLEVTTQERPAYWVMKSEPDAYSIDDLKKEKRSYWDGIRNYQARNFMMKNMEIGDQVLFYHSSTQPPGVVGLAKVVASVVPDDTALDKKSKYYDSKHTKENPRWFMVQIQFEKKFSKIVTLEQIKSYSELSDMLLIQKGQRLSIQPCLKEEFQFISKLAES
ncbi:MAG: EVE domain-containing protein [Oligoflexales bacterium]